MIVEVNSLVQRPFVCRYAAQFNFLLCVLQTTNIKHALDSLSLDNNLNHATTSTENRTHQILIQNSCGHNLLPLRCVLKTTHKITYVALGRNLPSGFEKHFCYALGLVQVTK